jgi:hypothetical protein
MNRILMGAADARRCVDPHGPRHSVFPNLPSWPDAWTPPVIHCLGIGLAGTLHLSCAFPQGVCQSP